MRRLLLLLVAGLAALVLAGGLGAGLALRAWRAPGPLPAAAAIVVPRGSTARVAAVLAADGVVASPLAFRLAALATAGDGRLRSAEFAFPARASLAATLAILRRGRPVQHRITIPEGLTAAEIATLVDAAAALDGEAPIPREGAVLPQTYDYERGTTRRALVERMERAMRRTLDREWRDRAPDPVLASPAAMLTLASIVERETGVPAERPEVAAVFLNRLRLGMRLQSDPTAAYAAAGGLGAMDRRLTRADLEAPNPYNTYVARGLPPGPICAPGLAAIDAVAHPAASRALYFVATGTGGHAFADDLPAHLANIERLREAVAARTAQVGTAGPGR